MRPRGYPAQGKPVTNLPPVPPGPAPGGDELGLAYLITTDRWLAIVGGILGGIATCLGLLIHYARQSNAAASKGHRP